MYPNFFKLFDRFKNLQTVFIRYTLYGLGLIDVLILPKLLDTQGYAGIEYYKNLIFLFPNVLLGASSGYIYSFYVEKKDEFDSFFKVSLTISITVALITGIFLNNYFIVLPLISINVYTSLEQKLKVNRYFFEAFLFKPLLSISVLFVCFLGLSNDEKVIILVMFSLAIFIWLIFVFRKINVPFEFALKKDYSTYYHLVKKSISITLCSLALSLLIFGERFFIERYYKNELPSYSFAFNLSQIVVILISVFSYLATVDHGEKLDILKKDDLKKNLKNSVALYLIFFLIYIVSIYFIAKFYPQFNNIVFITCAIAFAKGFNALVGIFSPVAVYKDYNLKMLVTVTIVFIINIMTIFILAEQEISLSIILIVDSLFLICYSLYILDIVFRRIAY